MVPGLAGADGGGDEGEVRREALAREPGADGGGAAAAAVVEGTVEIVLAGIGPGGFGVAHKDKASHVAPVP